MQRASMLNASAARRPFAGPAAAASMPHRRGDASVAHAAGSGDVGRRASLALTAAFFSTLARQASAADGKAVEPIYFGNGCFWGRQKDFTDTEKALGRKDEEISAVAGYAGGTGSAGGQVCYYTGPRGSVYEDLGHAEVVQLDLSTDAERAAREMAAFATTYFAQFQKTSKGMQRLDPQDAGPAYRNVVGLPGGVNSPLFKILEEKNVNGMKLVAGQGNAPGLLVEQDVLNTVWVVDTNANPFHLAEFFHQMHNGIGVPFGADYTRKQRQIAQRAGRIGPTGCPEIGGLFR